MNYILADFVVKFNTSTKKHVEFFFVPYSNINIKIIRLLFNYRCINAFFVEFNALSHKLHIKIIPVYLDSKSLIKSVELVSRPGLRIFWTAKNMSVQLSRNNFRGFYILTTSSGICSSHELLIAHILDKPISGEILLKINL